MTMNAIVSLVAKQGFICTQWTVYIELTFVSWFLTGLRVCILAL